MAVLKVIEIMASSPKGWEDATIAVKLRRNCKIRSVYIHHLSAGEGQQNL
jgi:hypothetical protein